MPPRSDKLREELDDIHVTPAIAGLVARADDGGVRPAATVAAKVSESPSNGSKAVGHREQTTAWPGNASCRPSLETKLGHPAMAIDPTEVRRLDRVVRNAPEHPESRFLRALEADRSTIILDDIFLEIDVPSDPVFLPIPVLPLP